MSADLVSFTVKPNFRALGKRFGSQTKLVAAAVTSADAGKLAQCSAPVRRVSVDAGELGTVELTTEDVIVTEQPTSGWAVETGAVDTGTGETVALDLDHHRRPAPARADPRRHPPAPGHP